MPLKSIKKSINMVKYASPSDWVSKKLDKLLLLVSREHISKACNFLTLNSKEKQNGEVNVHFTQELNKIDK